MTKELAIQKIEELVNYYSDFSSQWESKDYKEAQVRASFLDVFFEALGWQISGIPEGMTPEDKDVLVEYSIKDKTTKSLDYIFKIKNRHQFIVEAKKPSENISNPKYVFQAKTYGFLTKVPFVILTNFKEIRIYDISTKPNYNQIDEDLIFTCFYDAYVKNIDYLWSNFSKQAVVDKSLISLFTSRRQELEIDLNALDYNYINKKGEALLDYVFLSDLEDIRLAIGTSIIENTKESISEKDLNDVTQRLLDRILLIRFLEDNEIEDTELLRNIISKDKGYLQEIMSLSNELNKKYNGLLFHEYNPLESINIDDKSLKDNILKLYYPESPYNFSKISIEVLGQIFEQYLAKRLTINSDAVSLEIKPEVKKGGGIYFTPEFVVDKILHETLGTLLNDKKPSSEFSISKILDFSCGSGIFLIKAYKKLINYFETNQKLLSKDSFFIDSLGKTTLTMESKKKILQYNFFGIDIDNQAIEITKMSLYFTMLENYNEDKSPRPLLPDLDNNIICGNSIVDTEFFDKYPVADTDVINRINPLSWKDIGFEKFDIIVGNPPYLRIQLLEELYPQEYHLYLKENYDYSHGNFDLSVLFVEKGLSSLSDNGKLGFIIPNTVLRAKYGEIFRESISANKSLSKLIHFNDYQIFDNSTTYTCLMFFDNACKTRNDFDFLNLSKVENDFIENDAEYTLINKSGLKGDPWLFSSSKIHEEFLKVIYSNSLKLKDLSNLQKIFVGLQPSVNDVFLLKKTGENDKEVTCFSRALNSEHVFEKELIKGMVKGSKNIFRYKVATDSVLLFPYINDKSSNRSNLISQSVLELSYPKTWNYLLKCKTLLSEKEVLRGSDFYKFIYKKNHLLFDNVKILLPSLCFGSRFALDSKGEFYFTGSGEGGGGGYGLLLNDNKSNYDYYNLLGILNSKVISALIELNGKFKRGGYKGIDRTFIHNIPFPLPNTERRIIILSEISTKTKRLNSLYAGQATIAIQRLINQLENQINELALELYEINDLEIIKLIDELNE